jgi:cytoskeletal protein RodZ
MADARQHNRPRGEIFKEAREAQGLPLATVHESTKIPMDVLKAIEEGYTIRTLSPFYIRGFMKMYAQYLGVDINQVLEPSPVPEKASERVKEERPVSLPPEPFIRLDFQKYLTRENQQLLLKGLVGLLSVFLILRIVGCVRDHRQKKMAASSAAVPAIAPEATDKKTLSGEEKKAEEKKTVAPAPTAAPKKETPPKEEKSSPQPKEVRLTVKAKKSGWLQVKVDGSMVFQSILNSGATETWQAEQSIELSGKNIHSLEYEVNGKVLGELGRSDRSARRVVITKDGFSVKQ